MTKDRKRTLWNFADHLEGDKVVWIIVLMLILISIICMFSSTSRLLKGDMTRVDLLKDQLWISIIGLGIIVLCYNIKKISIFRWFSRLGFPVSFILLALLLSKVDLPFLKSIELNGARRILQFGGFQVHVFEVVKVAMVLYLAWALDAFRKGELKGPKEKKWQKRLYIYLPFLVTLLMIIPGSNSAALFVGGIMFIVILLGGGNPKELFLLAGAALVLIFCCWGIYELSDGKAMKRIGTAISRVFEDEDMEKQLLESKKGTIAYQEALDAIRQPYSAKIAVHDGGLIGRGPGQSKQKYIVPDISEDYMFSFIVEEYGILGAVLVIFLYLSLMARGSIIVRNCGSDLYAKLCVAGLCLLICGQAFLHMFVNADIGPMTGQTLPLISHGNSAFLCFSLAFGIILSFSRIAARKIERETKNAEPLVEMHEVQRGLGDLDDFESGNMPDDIEKADEMINEEFEDYGI